MWKHPGIFNPNRFLSGEREKINRYAYLPFGAGPRICMRISICVAGGNTCAGKHHEELQAGTLEGS
ncbi:MAG TPA: cytochrome P450 [Xanthobacteraceae bacterium]|nr:cytochrome P450 [Xanthobacteraceae bacterium]